MRLQLWDEIINFNPVHGNPVLLVVGSSHGIDNGSEQGGQHLPNVPGALRAWSIGDCDGMWL